MADTVHIIWRSVQSDLEVGGVAGAITQLWQLRRLSHARWLQFADKAAETYLTYDQFCLLASLWEISKEPTIEAMAPRLAYLPDRLCDSFVPFISPH